MPALRYILRQHNVDVALVNETHLHPAFSASIAGYHVLRLDATGENAFRGLLVATRKNLVVHPLPVIDTQSLQSLGVEIHHDDKPLRVYATYRPGNTRLAVDVVQQHFTSSTPTLVAGDWNAHHTAWGCRSTNQAGRYLYRDAQRLGYEIDGPDEPTHYSDNTRHDPTTIDLVVHRGLDAIDLEVISDAFGSDHQPVLVSLEGRPTLARGPPSGGRICWERFEGALHSMQSPCNEPLIDAASIDRLESAIVGNIKDAIDTATTPPSQRGLPPTPRWIEDLIQKKRRTRKLWQKNRDPATKTKLNRLIDQVRVALGDREAHTWEERISKACEDYPSLNKLSRQIMKKKPPARPLLHQDGSLRYSSEERADMLADYLAAQFQPNPSECPVLHAEVEEEVKTRLSSLKALTAPDPPFFSPSAVKKAIRGLKPRKAPGTDGITNSALRHLDNRLTAATARLFSAILRLGYFPRAWKEGLVVMIPKPGKDHRKPEGYRPITLLNAIAKLFERMLLPLLQPHLQPRPEQFGFRSGHSTTLQVARVIHFAAAAANRKESACAAFLDVAGAFDRVWHPGLLTKILRTGTPHHVVAVLAAFLDGRTFRVRVESAVSRSHLIAAGVPQGSSLSPALYALYTDDIPLEQGSTLALYADDIALLAKSLTPVHAATKLQRALDLLPRWLSEWRLTLSVAKTQAILFGGHLRFPPPLRLLGEQVPWRKEITYLGVTIDRRLQMSRQVKKAAAAAKVALFHLRPLLRSKLPLRTRLALYKSYVRPHLTYAAPAWYALASAPQRKVLQVVQNVALRRVTQAPYYVRNTTIQRDLRIESLEVHIGRLARNAYSRADASDHPHLQDIAPWHSRPPDKMRLPRDILTLPNSAS